MSGKKKRKQNWIYIYTPDGENKIASPAFIRNLLRIKDVDLSNIYNRLQRIEYQMDKAESPGRQEEILKLLREDGKHNLVWISNRVGNYQRYDLDGLLKAGLIVESKAGNTTMYSCAP